MKETYVNLYKNYRELLRLYSSPLMDACRDEAFKRFECGDFPSTKQEAYRYCDLTEALRVDYGMNLYRLTTPAHPAQVFRCDVPSLSTKLFFVVNDVCYPSLKPLNLPEGVIIGSLNETLKTHPEIFSKYYARLSAQSKDAYAALNTAFAQDGFVLYVPEGVQIDKPLQLIQMFQGEADLLATRRILVILEAGAKAQLMICDHSLSKKHCLSNQVAELFVGRDASLEYYELEMTHDKTVRVSNTFVSQAASSSLVTNTITLENGRTRNNLSLSYCGEHAESDLSGLCLLDEKALADNHVLVEHNRCSCQSKQLFKYILDDEACGVFGGKVWVHPHAQKTVAYQNNANLCNASSAHMHSMPQLEIYADDVKCSHGSAIGQMDESAVFYMRSRGLSVDEARMMLKFAFVGDVIDNIRLEPLRDRIRMLVGKRFRKQLSKCQNCQICP